MKIFKKKKIEYVIFTFQIQLIFVGICVAHTMKIDIQM